MFADTAEDDPQTTFFFIVGLCHHDNIANRILEVLGAFDFIATTIRVLGIAHIGKIFPSSERVGVKAIMNAAIHSRLEFTDQAFGIFHDKNVDRILHVCSEVIHAIKWSQRRSRQTKEFDVDFDAIKVEFRVHKFLSHVNLPLNCLHSIVAE